MDPLMVAAMIIGDILINTKQVPPPANEEQANMLMNACVELVRGKVASLQEELHAMQLAKADPDSLN